MIYDGGNGGTVEVLDNAIIIRRKGITGFLTQGLKGEKRLPFSSITSVQFKDPGITTGYIQFGILGGVERRGGVFDATTDENTVLFLAKALKEFRQLRDIVERRIGQPIQAAALPVTSTASFSEELTRLADLRDRGVLTEEEFAEEKARLRGPRNSPSIPAPIKSDTNPLPPKAVKADAVGQTGDAPKSTLGRRLGIGCLIIIGVLIGLIILGTIVGPVDQTAPLSKMAASENVSSANQVTSTVAEKPESASNVGLFGPRANAARSAQQYLDMTGFSRRGLIEQLSSDAGNGYNVADATAAVDSLTVDWNEQAARSAKQYLDMTGFSCSGLIEQLSSDAGSKYTKAQARHGAEQAGAC